MSSTHTVTLAAIATAQAIASAFVILLMGAFAQRFSLLTPNSNKELSLLVGTVLESCLAFSSMLRLSANDIATGGPLLFWPVIHVALSLLLGYAILPNSSRRGALLLCTALGNAGAIPTPLVQTLLSTTMDSNAAARGTLLVQLYLVTWRFLVWSVGPALLQTSIASGGKKNEDGGGGGSTRNAAGLSLRVLRQRLLPPPTIASLVGGALAFGPAPLRQLVLDGPLRFVHSAAKQVGAASPPLALLTLGFALGSSMSGQGVGDGGRTRFTTYEIVAACSIRLLLVPLSHLLLMRSALFDAPARTDPVHIVLLVQSAVPTALSVNSIFQREGVDTSSLGRLMLPMYAFAMPSIVGMMVLDVLVA